ncbi:hypothetical protein BGZ60DRAFT_563581 [Tricladium varicosporioides]|nr:hypothetical protein BGZ60DRAFT_563581 [Hymenoscyphus varicosporioides]
MKTKFFFSLLSVIGGIIAEDCNQWSNIAGVDRFLRIEYNRIKLLDHCVFVDTVEVAGTQVHKYRYQDFWVSGDEHGFPEEKNLVNTYMNTEFLSRYKLLPVPDCRIMVLPNMESRGLTFEQKKQVVAHELYHCVQNGVIRFFDNEPAWVDGNPTPRSWWFEGSAAYMSNYIYKSANQEVEYRGYDPAIPIYRQRNGYEAYLFFQAMEGRKTIEVIHETVLSHARAGFMLSYAEERRRLSTFPGFADDFEFFAKAFSSDEIHDSSGPIVGTTNKIALAPLNLPPIEVGKDTLLNIDFKPFTINVFTIFIERSNVLDFTLLQTTDVKMSYRLDSSAKWETFVPEKAVSISSCDGPVNLYLLAISTGNFENVTPALRIKKVSDTCTCKRQEGGPGGCPTQNTCLIGTWDIDRTRIQEIFVSTMASTSPNVKITKFSFSGAGTMVVSSSANSTLATFTWSAFTMSITASAMGQSVTMVTTIDGYLDGKLTFLKPDEFTLETTGGKGESSVSAPYVGKVTTAFDKGFWSKDMVMRFNCSGNRLEMVGYNNGTVSQSFMFGYNRVI